MPLFAGRRGGLTRQGPLYVTQPQVLLYGTQPNHDRKYFKSSYFTHYMSASHLTRAYIFMCNTILSSDKSTCNNVILKMNLLICHHSHSGIELFSLLQIALFAERIILINISKPVAYISILINKAVKYGFNPLSMSVQTNTCSVCTLIDPFPQCQPVIHINLNTPDCQRIYAFHELLDVNNNNKGIYKISCFLML
jgi:hypothetical protein